MLKGSEEIWKGTNRRERVLVLYREEIERYDRQTAEELRCKIEVCHPVLELVIASIRSSRKK